MLPRETQKQEQAIDGRMAEVQCDRQLQSERAAHQVALQVVLSTNPTIQDTPEGVETGQPTQVDMATPRAGQAEPQGNADAPDPTAVPGPKNGCWSWRRHCRPCEPSRHQPRCLRQRTCNILEKLLQHHTHCHHHWVKRRDSESLQAELAAALWAWLGPTLLVRAYDGCEHADNDGLTPGQRRKLSIELAGKRATLAETGAWIELLRMYVRDLLSREVVAGGDGTHTLQQSTTLKADTMRASDKMDSCNIRAALQILQTNTRAPQNLQTAAEVHSLVAVETEDEIAQNAVCSYKANHNDIFATTSKTGQAHGEECRACGWVPAGGAKQTSRMLAVLRADQLCCATGLVLGLRRW